MVIEPGKLLASGRAADVFDQGDGTVLRRYRTDHNTVHEAKLMAWLNDSGYPVPVVHHADGSDMLMDLVPGPTMIEDLEQKPWRLATHMKSLARLQQRLSELRAPEWLDADERIPPGRSLLHLDLHPMNVLMSPHGPVVIDWTNARGGDGDFDAALSYVLMAGYEARGGKEVVAQRLVTRLFRRYRGADAIRARLADAARFRLQDPNVTSGERAAAERLIR